MLERISEAISNSSVRSPTPVTDFDPSVEKLISYIRKWFSERALPQVPDIIGKVEDISALEVVAFLSVSLAIGYATRKYFLGERREVVNIDPQVLDAE